MKAFERPVLPLAPLEWLLEGEPWIQYGARIDLLGQAGTDPEVEAARRSMLADPQVQGLVRELAEWPWKVISSHKSAGQPFHKLAFVADLGFRCGDPGVEEIVGPILEHRSAEGPFQLPVNVASRYGGTGQDMRAWALCDAPLVLCSLVKLGLGSEASVTAAVEHLAGLVRDNGWPCAVSRELGSFRGPGRKEDPCPFANLAMLKLLAELEQWRDSRASRIGAEVLLDLWENSLARHPYQFYMGTDFRKLKVPFVWYDLMHVLEVLTRFTWLREDPRLAGMLALLERRMDQQGRFTLESVWTAWKGWEFGQKTQPSRWLTLCSWRIMGRVGASAALGVSRLVS